jgi:hypothetical protein
MENDLSCLLDGCRFGRSRAAVHLRQRENRLRGAANGLRHGLHVGQFLIALIGHRILEAGGVGRRLRLRENGLSRGGRAGCFMDVRAFDRMFRRVTGHADLRCWQDSMSRISVKKKHRRK